MNANFGFVCFVLVYQILEAECILSSTSTPSTESHSHYIHNNLSWSTKLTNTSSKVFVCGEWEASTNHTSFYPVQENHGSCNGMMSARQGNGTGHHWPGIPWEALFWMGTASSHLPWFFALPRPTFLLIQATSLVHHPPFLSYLSLILTII